jgi:uncharacterized protein YecT (DUF1311 family)
MPPSRLLHLRPFLLVIACFFVTSPLRPQAVESKADATGESSRRVREILESLDAREEEMRDRRRGPADWVYVVEPFYELGLTQTGGGGLAYRFRKLGPGGDVFENTADGFLSPTGEGKYVDTGEGFATLELEGKPGAKRLRVSLDPRSPRSPEKREREKAPSFQNFVLSATSLEERQKKRFDALVTRCEKAFATMRAEVPAEISREIQDPREWANNLRNESKDAMGVTDIEAWDRMVEGVRGRLLLLTVFGGRSLLPGLSGDYTDFQGGDLALRETTEGVWFSIEVVRGPTAHTGALGGLAKPKGNGRYFFREVLSGERYDNDPPAEILLEVSPSGQLLVSESNAERFHGMRAHFNGAYQKVQPRIDYLDKGAKAVLDLARKGDDALKAGRTKEAREAYLRCATAIGGGPPLASVFENTRGGAVPLAVRITRAVQGSGTDMQYALGALSPLRASVYVEPTFAWKMYRMGSAKAPAILSYHPNDEVLSDDLFADCRIGPEAVPLLEMAATCPPFDVDAFLKKNGLGRADIEKSPYVFWELAEEASRGGRFGPPDAALAFALVLRGGGCVAERAEAIKLAHSLWKNGTGEPFRMASCLSSLVGSAYLAGRSARMTEPEPLTAAALLESLGTGASNRKFFEKALTSATQLFEMEAGNFSGNRGFFETEANRTQFLRFREQAFLRKVSNCLKGELPANVASLESSDAALGFMYTQAMRWLAFECRQFSSSDPAKPDTFQFDGPEDLRAVQRMWIKYRDRAAELFAKLNPSQSENFWKSWLTGLRTAELALLMEQSGVPAKTLEPLRGENLRLREESLKLYREYKRGTEASPPQGLVNTGIRSPEEIQGRVLAQSEGLLRNVFEKTDDTKILAEERGAFAQIYNLMIWNAFQKTVNRYSRAVLGCNPPEFAGDPTGYYEDFEGGAVCVVRSGGEFSVSGGGRRSSSNQSAAVHFAGPLKEEVVAASEDANSGKAGPRLIVGRGMVCLEPGGDRALACLANTYVRVGSLTETGALLASKIRLGSQETDESEEGRRNAREFYSSGVRFFNPPEPSDASADVLEETWKRFAPVRKALNFFRAPGEPR